MIRFRISGYVFRISEPVVLERVEILSLIEQFQFNFLDDNRWQFILSGLKNTIIITFFAVLLGIFLGFVIAIVRSTHDKTGKLKILNVICRVYLTVIRGTPMMVQLMIMYFVIFASSRHSVAVATLAFGINSGAYVAEIVRGGIMSVDAGQMEAGRSLGMNYTQTMRHIIIPQAIKNILPALGNEMITLLKDTSLMTVTGAKDLMKAAQSVTAVTYQPLMPYVSIAVIYLVCVMALSKALAVFERRLRNSDRR
mgnify:CR=1 FL=1